MKTLTTLLVALMLLSACGDRKPYVQYGNTYKIYGSDGAWLSTTSNPELKYLVSSHERKWFNITWSNGAPSKNHIEKTKRCMNKKYPDSSARVAEWEYMKTLISCRYTDFL